MLTGEDYRDSDHLLTNTCVQSYKLIKNHGYDEARLVP